MVNRLEYQQGLVSVVADTMSVLQEHNGVNDGDGNPIPARIWSEADHAIVPQILIDDREQPTPEPTGNTPRGGIHYENGVPAGQQLLVEQRSHTKVVVRHDHYATCIRLCQALTGRFTRYVDSPELLGYEFSTYHGRSAMTDEVLDVKVDEFYEWETEFRDADAAHQYVVPLSVKYRTVYIDPDPEVLDELYTDFDIDDEAEGPEFQTVTDDTGWSPYSP